MVRDQGWADGWGGGHISIQARCPSTMAIVSAAAVPGRRSRSAGPWRAARGRYCASGASAIDSLHNGPVSPARSIAASNAARWPGGTCMRVAAWNTTRGWPAQPVISAGLPPSLRVSVSPPHDLKPGGPEGRPWPGEVPCDAWALACGSHGRAEKEGA